MKMTCNRIKYAFMGLIVILCSMLYGCEDKGLMITSDNCNSFSLEGATYEYPFKFGEMTKNGWEEIYGLGNNYMLQPKSGINNFTVKKDNLYIDISLYNPMDVNMRLNDCMVSSITMADGDDRPNVILPCNYDFLTTFSGKKHSEYVIETEDGIDSQRISQYAFPFESKDGYKCRLVLDVSNDYDTISSARYEMLDLEYGSDRAKENLEVELQFYFYGDIKSYQNIFGGSDYILELDIKDFNEYVEDFLVEYSEFESDKVIYRGKLDGFIDKLLKSTGWIVEVKEDGNLEVGYMYPNTMDIVGDVEKEVIAKYGKDYFGNQDAFNYYAERLNAVEDFTMTDDSITVKVIDGTIDNTDYSNLVHYMLGFKSLFSSGEYYLVETDDTTKPYFEVQDLFTITYEGEEYSVVAGYSVNGPVKVGQNYYLTTDDENIILTVIELELIDGSHPKSVKEYDNVAVWVDKNIKDYVESGDKLYLYEEW